MSPSEAGAPSDAPAERLLPPTPSRSPWQRLYRAAHRLRRRRYRLKATTLPVPVISVGNLHWGGTGKTPIVLEVARYLRDQGRQLVILSRGYGSTGTGLRWVSRGNGPLLDAKSAGDEPVLMADALDGVSVVVHPDRAFAGQQALEALDPPPDLLLLDDGFSHLRLARTLDLIVLPRSDPYGGGNLPPAGRLREPLESVRHAHAVLLSGATPGEGHFVAEQLRRWDFAGPGFSVAMKTAPPRTDQGPLDVDARVLLLTGIARPERVLEAAKGHGVQIVEHLRFPDHERYEAARLKAIRSAFDEHGAEVLLTTTKDAVKLRGRIDLPLAELPLQAEIEPPFWSWLGSQLESA